MNCKQGDLAVVVKCLNAPENIGAIRRVIRPTEWIAGTWPGWKLEHPLPNGDDCICDTCLRPIRGMGRGTEVPDYSDLHLEPTP